MFYNFRPRGPAIAVALMLCVVVLPQADAQLRVVSYNVLNNPDDAGEDAVFAGIFQAIAASGQSGLQRLPDVLAAQEMDAASATRLVNVLNGLVTGSPYAVHHTYSVGGDSQAIFYRADTVTLVSSETIDLRNNGGATRPVQHAVFRPVGYTSDDANVHVYSLHLKASTGSSNVAQRNLEANLLRQQVAALGHANVILAGDFNFYSPGESGYQTLIAAGAGQVIDPLNGAWNGPTYTQNPAGPFDDRFDLQLLTADLLDGEGVALIANTYRAFGNSNGVVDPALKPTLTAASDHLPVVADYQLPAKMSVAFDAAPGVMIRGASVALQTTIANTAPVSVAAAADELDYLINGAVAGIAHAASAGNVHQLALDTSAAGAFHAGVSVTTSSQGAQVTGPTTTNHAYTVLDHANGSFDGDDDLDELTLNFGNVAVGQDALLDYAVFNLVATAGYTAALDLDLIEMAGSSAFDGTFAPLASIAAGTGVSFEATFAPTAAGHFNATWLLRLSDEDLPGELSQTLTLHLLGVGIVPEPGAIAVLVLLTGLLALGRGRRLKPFTPISHASSTRPRRA